MAKFAKLIELKNDEQVLITLNYNDDKDCYELYIRTDLDSCVAQITVGIEDQDEAIKMLDGYSNEMANQFRVEMEKMFA